MEKLRQIQKNLKCQKKRRNNFGNFDYRNAEDILEAVKPMLGEHSLELDSAVIEVGGCMDAAQITGSALSFAKKYALGNLFILDDGHDADAWDSRGGAAAPPPQAPPPADEIPPGAPPVAPSAPNRVDVPNAAQTAVLNDLRDYYKTQETAILKVSKQKMVDAILAKFGRWPNNAKDGTLVKGYVTAMDVLVEVAK
jgi:hypothetical protein